MHAPAASIPISDLGEPFYEGSVQRLFAVPGDDRLMVTQTTARGSVFDVGALFEIPGNDVNRALFRHLLYTRLGKPETWQQVAEAIETDLGLDEGIRAELLAGPLEDWCQRGAMTHHEGMIDAESGAVVRDGAPVNPSNCNVVRKYQILKPERTSFLGAHLFDYAKFPSEDGFVVPLEYIVRFGITSASSVFKKYQAMEGVAKKAFEHELGVSRPLEAWQYLERPISDFTTKFEPEDRMISKQEAIVTSGLPGDQFIRSGKLAVLGAWVVRQLLEEIGLRLWDIKWEFAKDGDELVFVDTIDTDSFRATLFLEFAGKRYVNHYNKQAVRDYFLILHDDWISAIKDAKSHGASGGVAFTELLAAGQESGFYPATPEVDPVFTAIQQRKMDAIRDYMLGTLSADDTSDALREAGLDEIGFYRDAGKLDEFGKLNGI